MNKYERFTHFQDSANQVAQKVLDLIPDSLHTYNRDDQKLVAEIIALYAYDLAMHVAHSLDRGIPIKDVPDLTEWDELCYSCVTELRQPGSTYCSTCQQERDDELQDYYDLHGI